MRRLKGWILGTAIVWLAGAGVAPAAAAVPPGFSDTLVAAVGLPTALAFTPDGRLLVTTQGGALRVIQNDSLLATPALTIPAGSICTDSERGLLGVAVHPSFAANQFIYLFYTFETGGTPPCVNRVSRFTLPSSNVIDPLTEVVLIDNMPSPNGNHNAGDVQFGKDAGGNLTVFPAGMALPATSTLNFAAGQTRANNAVVQLGSAGGITIFYAGAGGASAHVIVDVVGYFE